MEVVSKRRRALLFGIPVAVVPGLAGWGLLNARSPLIEFPAPTLAADTLPGGILIHHGNEGAFRAGLPFTAKEMTAIQRGRYKIIYDDKESDDETPP